MNYEKYIGQTVTLPKGTAIYLHQYKTSIHPTKKKMKVILQEIEGEYFVYYDSRLYKNWVKITDVILPNSIKFIERIPGDSFES